MFLHVNKTIGHRSYALSDLCLQDVIKFPEGVGEEKDEEDEEEDEEEERD